MIAKEWFVAIVIALDACAAIVAVLVGAMFLVADRGRAGGLSLLVALVFAVHVAAAKFLMEGSSR